MLPFGKYFTMIVLNTSQNWVNIFKFFRTAGYNNKFHMETGSNRNINKAEVYHKKSAQFRSPLFYLEAHTAPETHWIKSLKNQ